MMQLCLARNIREVWCSLGYFRSLSVLALLPAAVFAQSPATRLARGIDRFENGKYNEAIQELRVAQPQLPKLADYIYYYLAASSIELKDFSQAGKDLARFHKLPDPSPLAAKAALLEAKTL